jgi:2'-5' RNA ligase
VRLFLAVFPPEAVRAAAHAAAAPLRRAPGRVSWVSPGNLHYTLRFLGEVGEDGARRAGEAAVEAAASVAAFEAALGGLGAFPDPAHARAIWVGLSAGAESLVALATALDRALAQRGFARPDRSFTPHLTLGRVRDPRADWGAALAGTPALSGIPARFTVDRLSVVESTLSPQGSIYQVRAEAPLTG